jgi:hypothetical protein
VRVVSEDVSEDYGLGQANLKGRGLRQIKQAEVGAGSGTAVLRSTSRTIFSLREALAVDRAKPAANG